MNVGDIICDQPSGMGRWQNIWPWLHLGQIFCHLPMPLGWSQIISPPFINNKYYIIKLISNQAIKYIVLALVYFDMLWHDISLSCQKLWVYKLSPCQSKYCKIDNIIFIVNERRGYNLSPPHAHSWKNTWKGTHIHSTFSLKDNIVYC